jgi:hypothetical protein
MIEKMNQFFKMIGEYYLGIEIFKQSRRNQSFLTEFYPDTPEAEIEKYGAGEAILASKVPPLILQLGGLACSLADRNPYASISLILAGELWRIGFGLYRKSTIAYAEKVKASIIEFEQLKQERIGPNSCRYKTALQRLEKLI